MAEAGVQVTEVKAFKTRSGNMRFVLADDASKEYSAFKEQVAAKLPGLEGRPTADARSRTRSPGRRPSMRRRTC